MSRAAVRQLAILGVLCLVGLAAFIAGLGWLSSLTATGAAALPAIDAATRTITTSIRNEPPKLDSMRASDASSIMVFAHIIEGLLRYDERGDLVPGVAERWEIGTEGATFWLREDARLERRQTRHRARLRVRLADGRRPGDGVAVRVHHVPGEERRGDQHGRAAADRARRTRRRRPHARDRVRESRCAYFDKLVASRRICPFARIFTSSRNGRYAADAADMLFNGPFVSRAWVHGASMRFEKNPTYWNRAAVKLNFIDIPYITRDANARLQSLPRRPESPTSTSCSGEALDQVLAAALAAAPLQRRQRLDAGR